MNVTGIDVGSRAIKLMQIDSISGDVVLVKKTETTFNPRSQILRMMDGLTTDVIVATGYGRKMVQDIYECEAITEILAHALGARRLFAEAGCILDIGGQDTKAIALDHKGHVGKFEMNDRCAAGTGKFLEFMATSFQIPIEKFGDFALEGRPGLSINSMCTVFAESEATSLMAIGIPSEDIALALHASVVKRSLSMLKRVANSGPIVFSGGVARNKCIVKLLENELQSPVLTAEHPEMMGALGAATHGAAKGV
ncbi:MAG: (R)-2-hydroxyacyl-CoA dehydratese activating ATPase [Thermodesulfobacteriota bacterium]|nr:(R)-2-hydroxyacyl-CoA dehydratese activating ATPase [Thermodesulfobacteriota bacterium]